MGTLLAVILLVGPPQDGVFGIILVANVLIGVGQERRAKRTLDRLAVLSAPGVRVIRGGRPSEIGAKGLGSGDLIDLRPGDQLVADGIGLAGSGLQSHQSLLAGASEPVYKLAGVPLPSAR